MARCWCSTSWESGAIDQHGAGVGRGRPVDDGQRGDVQPLQDGARRYYAILGDVGWQRPAIYRPYDHPRWGFHKSKALSALHAQRRAAGDAGAVTRPACNRTSTEPHDGRRAVCLLRSGHDRLAGAGAGWCWPTVMVWLDDEP